MIKIRTVKIENCSYDLFVGIRDEILDLIPFCLVNQDYSVRLKIAMFNFWDSDYIPEILEEYVLRPPKHREPIEELQERLTKVMDVFKKEE